VVTSVDPDGEVRTPTGSAAPDAVTKPSSSIGVPPAAGGLRFAGEQQPALDGQSDATPDPTVSMLSLGPAFSGLTVLRFAAAGDQSALSFGVRFSVSKSTWISPNRSPKPFTHSKLSCELQWKYPSTGTLSEAARSSCSRQARRNITRSESYTLPSSETTSAAAQPFSVMNIDLAPQSDCTLRGAQYMTSGARMCHEACIFGCDALNGIALYPGGSSEGCTEL